MALNCTEDDSLIFVGSGCTGAVHKLVHCLSLDQMHQPPVVFVSPFEHHSNLLLWQESKGTEVSVSLQYIGDVLYALSYIEQISVELINNHKLVMKFIVSLICNVSILTGSTPI